MRTIHPAIVVGATLLLVPIGYYGAALIDWTRRTIAIRRARTAGRCETCAVGWCSQHTHLTYRGSL